MGQQRKKRIGLLASIAGVALVLSGCAAGSDSGGSETVRVMLWGNDQDITSIKDAAAGFESAHPTSPSNGRPATVALTTRPVRHLRQETLFPMRSSWAHGITTTRSMTV